MAKNSQEVLDQLQEQNDSSVQEQEKEVRKAPKKNVEKKAESSKLPSVFDKFDNYEIEEGEESLYHVAIAKVHFDERTGNYDGQIPYVQKFIKRDYDNFMNHANSLGYTTKLLYSPINS